MLPIMLKYTYIRYTKTAGGVTTTYFYNGNTLLGENRSDGTRLRYFYDASGLCGFSYFNGNETKYYTYVKYVLGNIVMIKDDMGLPLVKYTYNEWGVCFVEAFNLNNNAAAELALGNLNPFRYRGYYYDTESGLYYLMSRYYDPEIGQFICPDTPDWLAPETIGGVDLYAYCRNNPIMFKDPTGKDAIVVVEHTGLPILGHIAIYVQDANGRWYKTEYLADGKAYYKIMSDGEMSDAGMRASHGKYHQRIDIEGDFSEVIDFLMQQEWSDSTSKVGYKEDDFFGSYNLLFNSCQSSALML